MEESRRTQLQQCTNDIPQFSLAGLHTLVKIVDVYDGDTFRACFFMSDDASTAVKFSCRAQGYDSPEIRPRRNIPDRDAVIAAARAARDHFKKLVRFDSDTLVEATFGKFDKYGRPLVTLYLDGVNINDSMVESGHGYEYHGGKKK